MFLPGSHSLGTSLHWGDGSLPGLNLFGWGEVSHPGVGLALIEEEGFPAIDEKFDLIQGNGKVQPFRLENLHVGDSHHFPRFIEEGSSGVSGVDGRRSLNVALPLKGSVGIRNDPFTDSTLKATGEFPQQRPSDFAPERPRKPF